MEHLKANIEALSIELSKEDMDEIDSAVPFDAGFPNTFIFRGKYDVNNTASDIALTGTSARLDSPRYQEPIKARTEI